MKINTCKNIVDCVNDVVAICVGMLQNDGGIYPKNTAVNVTLVDENKHESTWHGKLKGSRMSTTSTYSKIWD